MNIRGMIHFTVLADDLDRSREFYRDVLGLQEGYRPPLGFPGAWFFLGEHALLHIVARTPLPEPRAGVLDHMAFTATGLPATLERLKRHDIPYELIHQVGSQVWQVFCHDPNGAKIKLDFAPDEFPGLDAPST
jgi:catechol 2,3-dioxygenase-like lactoylglutathione lyase family enzyme